MFQTAFECFPWDLDLEGYDESLARLAGDIGVDAILVPAVHEGIREIRPRAAEADRAFVCRAAAHFQPDAKCYGGFRIRPIPAAWMKSRNPLEKIAAAAEKHRLALRVSISCCQGDALAERYPHAACIDFFGRPSANWLCPSHPDVRSYITALVEDLTANFPVTTLKLESADFGADFMPGWAAHPVDAPTTVQRLLFSWCFCAACCQRAADRGIDVAVLRAAANDLFRKLSLLQPISDSELRDSIASDRGVEAYRQSRIESVTSLIDLLKSRAKCPLYVGLSGQSEATAAVPTQLKSHCDGFCIPIVDTREESWPIEIMSAVGGPARCNLELRCYPPYTKDGPSIVTAVHRASHSGIASITFDNYGKSPEPCLDWVRQAIRYARREAT